MATAVYIASLEPDSGKTLVSLGAMEAAAARVARVGYFRPVVAFSSEPDPRIQMMRSRYRLAQSYEQSYGVTTADTRGLGENVDAALVHRILGKYEELAAGCDLVIVEGTDYTGASAAFEFALNAEIAAHLGAATLVVIRAHHHGIHQLVGAVSAARKSLSERHESVLGFVINRVPRQDMEQVAALVRQDDGTPVWLLPEEPELSHANLAELAEATSARLAAGGGDSMQRAIKHVLVGAMTLPHLMERLQPDSLVIAPGDRSDVVLLAQASRLGSGLPAIAGLLLTGGYEPDPILMRFAAGMGDVSVPTMITDRDTYETADIVARTQGSLEGGDERRIAVALRLIEDHIDIDRITDRLRGTRSDQVTPVMFERRLVARARADRRHIVLPEGADDRILMAADRLVRRDAARLTVLGDVEDMATRAERLGSDLTGVTLVDPLRSPDRERYAEQILRARAAKGMSEATAHELSGDPSWFGTLMVATGDADGMVSGAAHTTADTVRPALQIIRTAPGISVVSSVFLMALPDRVHVYGDCAVVPNPDAHQLADIAVSSAATAAAFGIEPRVAMLSYSTGSSGAGVDVAKVAEATRLVRERAPELAVEGPIQFDAAVDPGVAAAKLPGSAVAGRATVFVFPDLNTGNNTYKAVQRSAGALAIGPVLQGLRLPVNDLSRGATVADIVNTVVITAIQAQRGRQGS
jgi:phosphate acetyltransferase